MKNGEGIMYWANGAKYEGGWQNDKKNGKGKFIDEKGEKFEGEFLKGAFIGN